MDILIRDKLINRAKSYAWRAGGLLAVMACNYALENVGLLNLPDIAVVVIGLVLNEVTKFLRVNLPDIRAEMAIGEEG